MYVHICKEAQTFKVVSVSQVTCSDNRYIKLHVQIIDTSCHAAALWPL